MLVLLVSLFLSAHVDRFSGLPHSVLLYWYGGMGCQMIVMIAEGGGSLKIANIVLYFIWTAQNNIAN